jgi:Zn finger protein HypA/HybF involved in hydrogenase expression
VNSNNLSEDRDFQDEWSEQDEQSIDKKSEVLVECFVCGNVWTTDDRYYQCPQCGGEDVEPVRR